MADGKIWLTLNLCFVSAFFFKILFSRNKIACFVITIRQHILKWNNLQISYYSFDHSAVLGWTLGPSVRRLLILARREKSDRGNLARLLLPLFYLSERHTSIKLGRGAYFRTMYEKLRGKLFIFHTVKFRFPWLDKIDTHYFCVHIWDRCKGDAVRCVFNRKFLSSHYFFFSFTN